MQLEIEMDPSILQRRQKQIDYGKNTVGYQNYLSKVPMYVVLQFVFHSGYHVALFKFLF